MKSNISSTTSMAKWWAVSVAIMIVLEIGVCLLLFIPQNQARANVARLSDALEKQRKDADKIPATLDKIRSEADAVESKLEEANLLTKNRAEVAIMEAVARANTPAVMFLSLTPVKPTESGPKAGAQAAPKAAGGADAQAAAARPTDVWLVRVKGHFPDLVVFLNKLEQEGILLDSTNFEADGVKQRGIIELSVAAKVCSPQDVAKAMADAQKAAAPAAAAPAAAGKPAN